MVIKYFVQDHNGGTLSVYETLKEAKAAVDFNKGQIIKYKKVMK